MYQTLSCIFSLSESSSSAEEAEDKLSSSLHEGQDGVPSSTLGSGSENEETEKEEGSVPLGQSHLHQSDISSVPVHSSSDAYSDGIVGGDGGRKEHSDKTKNNSEDDDKKSWSAVTLEVNQHMVSENHHSQHQDHQGHRNGQSQASASSRPPNRDPPAGRRRHSSEKSLPVSFSNSGHRVTGGLAAAAFAAILFLLNAHLMYNI